MTRMMQLMTAASIALILLTGYTNGDEFTCAPLPDGDVPLITSFISVDNSVNDTTICRMQYEVPYGANLWQGMVAATQQHGDNFTFMATLNSMYGHFITTVNGVTGVDGYFWGIFDAEGIATPVGVDWIDLEEGSAYIFNYQYYNNSNPEITNYTGMCLNASDVPANTPLTYLSTYISVSDKNCECMKKMTNFKPVCNQLVLFNQSGSSLYDVMMLVNDQVPLDINVVLSDDMTVMKLNNVSNCCKKAWTPFNVKTNMTLPRDLSMTQLSDGDQIKFVYVSIENDTMGMETMSMTMSTTMSMTTSTTMSMTTSGAKIMTPSVGMTMSMTTSGAKIMTPSVMILSSIFMMVGALFI